jgi:hypothetical protein
MVDVDIIIDISYISMVDVDIIIDISYISMVDVDITTDIYDITGTIYSDYVLDIVAETYIVGDVSILRNPSYGM